jgi:hypothetical protein
MPCFPSPARYWWRGLLRRTRNNRSAPSGVERLHGIRYPRGKLETLEEPRVVFGTADDAQKSSRYRTSWAQRAPCYQIPAIRAAINRQARMLQISLTPGALTPGYLDVVAPRLSAGHHEMNGQVQLGILWLLKTLSRGRSRQQRRVRARTILA